VIGAMVSSIGRSKLAELLPHATTGQLNKLSDALGAGGGAHVAAPVEKAMNLAYVDALGYALVVAAAMALLGAVLAWVLVSTRAAAPDEGVVLDASAISPAVEEAEAAELQAEPARA
jgi:hypothetical protein